jgi:hypothetical protein
MSGLLFLVGAVAFVAGAVMIGFGIPVNEFSFGNTLILAGTTAAVGGLVVAGLGAVVAQLQSLTAALANRAPNRSSRPVDMFDPAAGSRAAPPQGRIPFPARPQPDTGIREPYPSTPADTASGEAANSFTPTLRNPDEPSVTVDDEVSLSPHQPMAASAPAEADAGDRAPPHGTNGFGMPERRHEMFDTDWRPSPPPAAPSQIRQPQTAYFDAMWPAEAKPAKSPAGIEAKSQLKPEQAARETVVPQVNRAEDPEATNPFHGNESRAVAILKSGVVDGMGYTLYVDGSIEAELPQGTLRFASINELRSHLEKNA